ncbi:MAG TPA: hypothetical protein VFG39_07910, partial [Balneolaceae bacterium]|nr:hypothetical protein [Balneolaceae bacterium]
MRYFQTKLLIVALFVCIGISACELVEVDKVTDPNNPSSEAVLNDATSNQLQNLVNGLEVKHRDYLSGGLNWWALVGSFGRESYYIFASDPRSATEWLQYPSQPVPAEQNHAFWNDGSGYVDPYEAVRQANLLILAVKNTDAISETQKNGYVGFAQTIKGYQLLIPLMHQYQNGIRIALP